MPAELEHSARYAQLVQHATALTGTVSAAIDLFDADTSQLQRIACYHAAASETVRALKELRQPGASLDLDQFLYSARPTPFISAVLSAPGPREEPLEDVLRGQGPNGTNDALFRSLGVTHVVGCRLELRGHVHGLMLFAMDHPTTPEERAIIEGFAFQAARYTDATWARESGRVQSWQRLETVLAIADATNLGTHGDLSSIVQAVVDRLRSELAADVVVILLLNDANQSLEMGAVALSEAGRAAASPDRFRAARPGRGVTSTVLRTGHMALVSDMRDFPGASRGVDPSRPEALLVAPLITRGKTIGVLRASVFQAGRFGEPDLRLMEIVARQTAVVVENARLYQTTREQKDALALFGRIFAASPEAITLVDPENCIQQCNPAAERLYGYAAAELIGQPLRNLFSAQNPTELLEQIQEALRTAGEWRGETIERRKDGSEFYADIHRSVVRDDEGRPIGSVGIVRDLTRRREMQAQLLQSEKLRSLGVLASGVAHQMNNVLASILGQSELLLTATTDPPTAELLRAIIQSAEDGAAAVRRIQEFARIAPVHSFAPVDLVAIAHDVAGATAPRWRDQAEREGRAVSLLVAGEPPVFVSGLAPELREAVTNVVLNAVDAMPQGGSIRVSVSRQEDDAVLHVVDEGTGMSDEVLQRAFDPFFTTKPFGSGTGLGLALTHGIVQRHGGALSIQSQPGRGTSVEIKMPAIPPPTLEAAALRPMAPGALRVLVVDDEPALAGQLRVILSMDGHDVRVCQRGAEAVAALASEPFDLVITDLGMPEVNGWEVAKEAKAHLPKVHVGLITGWAGEIADQADLKERGVDFVISKPYRIQTIRDAVSKVTADRG